MVRHIQDKEHIRTQEHSIYSGYRGKKVMERGREIGGEREGRATRRSE